MWQGRAGQVLTAAIGRKHHVRALETTHGSNGFHPHVHAILFVDKELGENERKLLAEAWSHQVSMHLGSRYAPNDAHGTRLDASHRSDYIAKLGLELSAITSKQAKNGNRTMWQVAQAAANGDGPSQGIWRRYARDMKHCRQLCWSKGAKLALGVKRISDRQIADDGIPIGQPIGVAHVLAQWQGQNWDKQARQDRYWLTRVISTSIQGAASIATLPGQDVDTPPGIVAIKREPTSHTREHLPLMYRNFAEDELAAMIADGKRREAESKKAAAIERAAFWHWVELQKTRAASGHL
jgi:hypothetical protein